MGKQKKEIATVSKVRLSDNALKHLDEITWYIAIINQQPLNAVKVGDKIIKVINKIAVNPLVFMECAQLPTKNKIYRRAVCMSWVIIYKIINREILILGIVHGSRQASSLQNLRKIK